MNRVIEVIEVTQGQGHVLGQGDEVGGVLIQVLADLEVVLTVLLHMTLDLVLVHTVGLVPVQDVTDPAHTVVILQTTVVQDLGHQDVILAQGHGIALILEAEAGHHTTPLHGVDQGHILVHVQGKASVLIHILHILAKEV